MTGSNDQGSTGLDRQSFVPLYYQLAEALKERLEAGVWAAGDRFPSELELSQEFGVSRMVVRPALGLLVGDGNLERIKGSGTFVRPAKARIEVRGLADLLREPGQGDEEVRILEVGEGKPRHGKREMPQLERLGPRVTRVVAVIALSGLPVCLCDSHTSAERAPWVLAAARGILDDEPPPPVEPRPPLDDGEVVVETAFAGRWEAAELGISPGDPTLLASLVQGSPSGPVEFARITFRTDSVQLRLLTPSRNGDEG